MNKKFFMFLLLFFISTTQINCFKPEKKIITKKILTTFESILKKNDLKKLKLALSYNTKQLLQLPLSCTGESKWTCLHFATIHNLTDIALFIIEQMVKLNLILSVRDAQNNTPLHFAAMIGNIDIVKKLVENDADINAKNNQKETPLIKAKQCGQTEIETFLSEKAIESNNILLFWNEKPSLTVSESGNGNNYSNQKNPYLRRTNSLLQEEFDRWIKQL